MKKFAFTLEAVLKYKLTVEKSQKAALAETNARLAQLLREEQELLAAFQRARLSQNRRLRSGEFNIETLKIYDRYFTRLSAEYAQLLRRIEITEAEKERQEQALIKTMRELKSYRKLRDEQYAEYLKEVQAEEAGEISEFVGRRTAAQ